MATTTLEHPDALTRSLKAMQETDEMLGEKMVINMGPSHPSTHGVLRMVLELDGEVVTKAVPEIGYLHRGDEKIAENMQYNQFVPYTDRLDYLSPIANNVAYALAIEKLMGWELPPRGKAIRVICCELARISSHLLATGCLGMDLGATTLFLYTFTEREKIYNMVEQLSGARFTTSYTRVGGQTRDLPPAFLAMLKDFLATFPAAFDDVDKLVTRNRIFVDRCRDVGVISKEDAMREIIQLVDPLPEQDTRKEWVGLTDDERNEMIGRIQHDQYTRQRDLINSTQIITEMYLKEKNT